PSGSPCAGGSPTAPIPEPQAPRTSDFYGVSERLPSRFIQPARFQGYRCDPGPARARTRRERVPVPRLYVLSRRKKEPHPLYRTSNQSYGSRAPTVHEMPTCYRITSHAFTSKLAPCGMYQDNGLNTQLDKSRVTGPGNFITTSDRLNFHPSYNPSGPSFC
ncbi:CI116 protein, partial [Crypturellus undulatus]|nr:CI116 protein [Crypturellus undulatus]